MTDAQKMFIEVIIQMLERGELEFDGVMFYRPRRKKAPKHIA
jgi:hypothetical protein